MERRQNTPAMIGRSKPTMREFIVSLLNSRARPLSISQFMGEFERAGYNTVRSSIRGRLNELTYEGHIRRVAQGVYAALDHGPSNSEQAEEARDGPPHIPLQEYGPSFEVSTNERIAIASSGRVSQNDNTAQLEAMREVLLRTTIELIALTEGSNLLAGIRRIAQEYGRNISGEILSLSIDKIYAWGVRLENANHRFKQEVEKGELPDADLLVGECLDSLLAIHGPFVISTDRGRQLLDLSRIYNATKDDEIAYKVRAIAFAESIAASESLVEKDVAETIEALNADIGEGPFPERSSDVARRANRNLVVTIAKLALAPVLVTGFVASQLGSEIVGGTAALFDAASAFLNSHIRELRMLAAVAGQDLSWLVPFLDWWEGRKSKQQKNDN